MKVEGWGDRILNVRVTGSPGKREEMLRNGAENCLIKNTHRVSGPASVGNEGKLESPSQS